MAKEYSRAEWARIQSRFPEEDRIPWEQSPDKPAGPSATAREESGTIGAVSAARNAPAPAPTTSTPPTKTPAYTPDPQDVRDPITGLTPAQIAARKAAEELAASLGVKVDPNTGMIIKPPAGSIIDPNTGKFVSPAPAGKTVVRSYFEGTGKNRVKVTVYSDGTETREAAPEGDSTEKPSAPGKAWIWDEAKKQWVIPPAPGNQTDYDWDDNAGWTLKKKSTAFVTGTSFIGFGANRILRTFYSDGTYVDTPAPETTDTGAISKNSTDPALIALIESLKAQNASFAAAQAAAARQAQIDAQAAMEAATKQKRESALAVLTDRFSRYGLASLVPKIRELITSGASEDTIALQLQDTEEYKQRFIANQDRLKKGLAVLDPGTYIGLEDRYRQILRAYGLKQFDNDAYVTQFLANDVSPEELSSRVVTAVQRVQNADPAVSGMLKQFYGIGTTDMVAYVLDPSQQFPKIERQVAAAEIGVAAARQGLTAGVNVAEQLAAQGITQAEAQRGYSTIANILPQATKLSEIYTDVLDQYGQAEAEQEVFNSLASAQRKRQRLAEREIAAFSGQSGLGRGSLGSTTGGQI